MIDRPMRRGHRLAIRIMLMVRCFPAAMGVPRVVIGVFAGMVGDAHRMHGRGSDQQNSYHQCDCPRRHAATIHFEEAIVKESDAWAFPPSIQAT